MKFIDENGFRKDGRKCDELRPTRISAGVLPNANGSALIEQGGNRIIVAVYGPREIHPRHLARPDRALLRCRYHMAPFSVPERKSPAPSRREIELSKVIREALEPAIFLEEYPRTTIDIFIEVLQADGGTRVASITAASVALAEAGIPMKDLVTAVAIGKIDGTIVLDLNHEEDQYGGGDMPIAMMPILNKITLIQADGLFTYDEIKYGLELAKKGIDKLYKIQREALRKIVEVTK